MTMSWDLVSYLAIGMVVTTVLLLIVSAWYHDDDSDHDRDYTA